MEEKHAPLASGRQNQLAKANARLALILYATQFKGVK
jgi:hypothetical protein